MFFLNLETFNYLIKVGVRTIETGRNSWQRGSERVWGVCGAFHGQGRCGFSAAPVATHISQRLQQELTNNNISLA